MLQCALYDLKRKYILLSILYSTNIPQRLLTVFLNEMPYFLHSDYIATRARFQLRSFVSVYIVFVISNSGVAYETLCVSGLF